jgi:predicted transposase YbfD/YdcC
MNMKEKQVEIKAKKSKLAEQLKQDMKKEIKQETVELTKKQASQLYKVLREAELIEDGTDCTLHFENASDFIEYMEAFGLRIIKEK